MSAQPMDIVVPVSLTPSQVAHAFWNLDSEQQADFFAVLENIAGINLCFQMAGVVSEIVDRTNRGDYDAMNGFRTMFNHASEYAESASGIRASAAHNELFKMARGAKERIA